MAAQTQAGRGVLAEGSETLEPSEGYLKRHRTDGMGQSERLGVRCRVMGGGEGRGVNGNWNRLCVTKGNETRYPSTHMRNQKGWMDMHILNSVIHVLFCFAGEGASAISRVSTTMGIEE
ncbi:hypothetical protein EYC84_007370 [Monilinia fructicola]|uniref:Uncharacterized protein n=1 Tax=Monilinia fructicola TaxID=38448 RepID=A0A5M9JG29_MONFR|nr:hypothetical protein EYC84_007370 [Monilinia fructicola]